VAPLRAWPGGARTIAGSHHRWLVVMFVAQGAAAAAGPDYRTDFVLPESESNEVFELLDDADPNSAGFSA